MYHVEIMQFKMLLLRRNIHVSVNLAERFTVALASSGRSCTLKTRMGNTSSDTGIMPNKTRVVQHCHLTAERCDGIQLAHNVSIVLVTTQNCDLCGSNFGTRNFRELCQCFWHQRLSLLSRNMQNQI